MRKSVAILTLLMMVGTGQAFAELPITPQEANAILGGTSAGAQLSNARDMMERARVAKQIQEDLTRKDAQLREERKVEEYKGEIVEFTVSKFDYEKSEVIPQEQLDALTAEYLNKSITINDLYQLVGKINNLYADGGYVTCKAFLPPQKVTGGVVKLLLVEGKTGNVTITNNKDTCASYVERRVKLPSGEIMNVNELNKRIMLFNGTNDAQLRVSLKAGEKPGTTDFEIVMYEPQKYNSTLFTDDAGNSTTGLYRIGYFWNVRSLTGVRDSLTLGTIWSRGSLAWNFLYDTPVSPSGTKISFGYSGNRTKIIDGDFESLDMRGRSNAFSFAVRQPWLVNETTRSEAGLEFNHQTSKTTYLGDVTWVDDKVRDASLYYSHTSYGNSHFFYQKHSYAIYGNYDSATSDANDVSSMHYYKLNTYYQKSYQHRQMIAGRFDFQKTWNDYLPGSRYFYIGGMNSVRGYKESYLGGETGYSMSLEYQVPISKDFKHNAFFFWDYGNVSGGSAFNNHVLQSLGLGIKSNWNKHIYSTLSVGFPLIRDLNEQKVSSMRIHYMLSGTF